MKVTLLCMIFFVALSLLYGVLSTEVNKTKNELALQSQYVRELEDALAVKREVAELRTALNYCWPIHLEDWTEGELSSPFGERSEEEAGGLSDGYHEGLDLWGVSHVQTWKARVCSVADGIAEHWLSDPVKGEWILVHHDDGNKSAYHHLSKCYILDGERVTRGQVIGRQGDTGISDGIHLHFELYIAGKLVNPLKYIKLPNEK